ncbi:annexin A13-like [Planococcus citri]|uniref:annexin A13-like n=1 Tax=Planococcus citri TaxID=170843 RepID=UPI0031F7CEC6
MGHNPANVSKILQFHWNLSIFAILLYISTHLILYSAKISATPTIKPYPKFNAEKDIETIHFVVHKEAGQKVCNDTDKMVRMICHRCRKQRQEMQKLFQEKYKEDIISYCEAATDAEFSFNELLEECFKQPMDIYKDHLHREISKGCFNPISADKLTIVEILLTIPPEKKEEFFSSYNETYKATIQKHVEDNLQGDLQNVIKEMVNRNRLPDIPPDKINWDWAKQEAQKLFDERKKWKNHRCELDRILMETPIQQLNATLVEFKKIDGKELDEMIQKKMEKDKRDCYKDMVFFAKNKHDYYARRIHHAMKGLGTQDSVLNRIIGIHSEEDLKEIATAYQLNTGDSLIHGIKGDTTLHHEMLLRCLSGEHMEAEKF